MQISSVAILGGGSAGFMAALTLKRKLPHLDIRVVRSPDIGIIGVGEGTTAVFPRHFFEYLKLKPREFYLQAEPTWKLGIKFIWGRRKYFYYTFAYEYEKRLNELARNNGFYYTDEFPYMGNASAYMEMDKAFPRQPSGLPSFHNNHAFHIENKKLAAWLEQQSRELGVRVTDSTVKPVKGGAGIEALLTPEGERITADLYVDASGFRSELLGGALEEPFVSYSDSLFCDRAVIGGWSRGNEPVHPYTIAETMNNGWCWQIEHENFINRGYVYASNAVSDDEALRELMEKNPKISTTPRVVKYRSGRYKRGWIGNVVAVGNAAGFVEPLEATALQVICVESSALADTLLDSLCDPGPSIIELYNRYNSIQWDDIRDFLAVHYRFNTRLDTPFWKACRSEVKLHGAQDLVDFYVENGPSVVAGTVLLHPSNSFRMDGYLVMLVGQGVPHKKPYFPTPAESAFWRSRSAQLAADARERGMGVKEALAALRNPNLKWN